MGEDNWKWNWDVHAYANKVMSDEKTIAIHMLRGAWLESIRHEELDHFHFIGNTSFLDVSEIQAVGRRVWIKLNFIPENNYTLFNTPDFCACKLLKVIKKS
ncbi:hypothetical protein N9361_08255 [Alphaproteobacteria bacterium]|nr:hypothetical protein [Alphaproteobacteria bacterium]